MTQPIAKIIILLSLSLSILFLETGCSTLKNKLAKESKKGSEQGTKPTTKTAGPSTPKFMLPALNDAQQKQALEAKRDYRKALEFLKDGKNKRALTMLKSITSRYPKLSGPWINQGIIHINLNRLPEAEKTFNKALSIYPDNPYALNMLGIVHRELGQFEKAKNNYEKALKIDKHYAKAHLNLGILADLYLRDLPLALKHFKRYQALQKTKEKRVSGWIKDIKRRIKANKA
ncbi:MAG: tetratricopeptide repeat protein [Pseudomonadales bacterium]|nr:tetratricopeptide repeat protein [Pseudomonadales bacterium]